MSYIVRDRCRLCESKKLISVFELVSTPPANAFISKNKLNQVQESFPLEVFQCEVCSHVQLLVVVNPDMLFSNYVYVSGTSPVFVKHFKDYAEDVIRKFNLNTDDFVLDIGSNDGTLLKFFKNNGMRILGVDPASKIAHKASKSGIETIPNFFDLILSKKILDKYGSAKVITANNVFAHVDDLIGLTNAIKLLLSKDSVFVFEVSYLKDVYEKCLFDMTYHEHLAYHSVLSLDRFFNNNGLEIIDVKSVNTHGGSIRIFVQMQDGVYSRIKTVNDFIEKEKLLGLDKISTMKDFGKKINALGYELKTILTEIKNDGLTIAGFGAPAKATSLMYHFGIDSNTIEYIIDDSPLKQGLYSPGMHIPIVSSEILIDNPPEYLLILAWNFKDSIIKKNKQFYDNGGKFIIPLPKVEVI